MARKKISQWDARQYKRRLEELEAKTRNDRSVWNEPFLFSVHIDGATRTALEAVNKLGHPIACLLRNGELHIHGVR